MSYFDNNRAYDKATTAVINAIKADKFKWDNYCSRKAYRGTEIQTTPLHASYGQIGFSVDVYDNNGRHMHTIQYDWEMNKLTVDSYTLDEIRKMDRREEFYAKMKDLMTEYKASFTLLGVISSDINVYCNIEDDEELLVAETDDIDASYFIK